MWWVTVAAVVVGLVGAARKRPPVLGAVILGVGVPLLSQALYDGALDTGVYVALLAVGLVAGVVLHQVVPSLGTGPWASRWLPWVCQLAWSVGLVWAQYAAREYTDSGFHRALGFFAFAGALWAGFAVARQVRPHLREIVVDTMGVEAWQDAAGATVAEVPAMAGVTVGAWQPSHRVPASGLDAWTQPDPSQPAATRLPAGVEVRVVERRGDWALVDASTGWSGWVDGRHLP